MEKIEIKVTKTNISLTNGYVLNQGEYQVDKCKFTFSEEYEDLVKKAVFVNGDTSIDMVILNDECDIPYEILQTANEFTLKVYGYQVQDEELVQRYSPTALKIFLREGSYVGSNEVITPSQFEQYEQALHDGLDEIDDKMQEIETEVDGKIQEVDGKLTEVDGKIDEVDTAITETNNLDLNVSDKVGKDVTITLTKKDASTKTVTLSDGTSLMFNWQGTSLGIKTDEDEEYTYVNLQGIQGIPGPQGDPFQVKKTYANVDLMIADYDNMEINDYVMISGDIETQDNATLWVKTETPAVTTKWVYLADFSGASGIQGPTGATPNLQIGTVVTGETSSASITGTAENPILNLTLQKGDKGNTGATGQTGNGISSITKTSTSGLVDTYTIAYTNGTSTTFDVTNGEVTQAQLDETNERVERAEMVYNALPKVNGSGESVTLTNTAETPLKIELSGNTSQFSTTGKNLYKISFGTSGSASGVDYSIDNEGVITLNGTPTASAMIAISPRTSGETYSLNAGTYAFSGTVVSGSYSGTLGKYVGTGNYMAFIDGGLIDASVKRTIESASNLYSYIYIGGNVTCSNLKVKIQLESGKSATSYEPYTNGASPNPDYPQDIEVVSGDNTIKVEGKNLFNKDTALLYKSVNTNTGELSTTTNKVFTSGFIKVQPNTNYYLSGGIDCAFGYDKEKRYLVMIANNKGSKTINTGSAEYVRVKTYNASDEQEMFTQLNNSQMELGTTATTYEPYQSQEYSVNLGNIELCKINDYKDKIKRSSGKNIFDGELELGNYDSGSGRKLENDNFVINKNPIPVEELTTYKISSNGQGVKMYVFEYKEDLTYNLTSRKSVYENDYLTTNSGTKYICFRTLENNTDTQQKIQVEKGTTATTYEPYGKVWCKYREVRHLSLNISDMNNINDDYPGWVDVQEIKDDYPNKNTQLYQLTSYLLNMGIYKPAACSINTLSSSRVIFLPKTTYSLTQTQWKTNYPNLITELYYGLQTPYVEPITDTTLINQLDLLEKAFAYQNQTNISQQNNDKPFVIDAETVRDLSNIFDI